MLYIARGSFWVLFAQGINSMLSLVLIVAFANLLPKELYGIYKYILAIAAMLNIFTLSGMNNAVSRTVAMGNEGALRPAVTYQLKWNTLMLLASLVLGGYYFLHGDHTLAFSLIILGIFVPCTLAFNTYSSFLDGKKKFRLAYTMSVLSTLIYSVGMLLILLLTDNLILIVATYAIATFIPSYIFYQYVLRTFNPPHSDEVTDTLKYGRELTFLRFADPVVSQIDKIVLAHFWGPAQLAIYSLAFAIPNRISFYIKRWISIGFPKFAEKTVAEINKVFFRRIVQGLLVGSVATGMYIFLSPYLFKYLLPQYVESIFYSQLLSLNFILALPNRFLSLLFTSQRLSSVLFQITIIQSIATVILYVVFGIYGGLLGLVIANLLLSVNGFFLNSIMWMRVSRADRAT